MPVGASGFEASQQADASGKQQTSGKQRAGAMSHQQATVYQAALYQQPMAPGPYLGGASQTISRSSNLHQHLAMLRAHQQQQRHHQHQQAGYSTTSTWFPASNSYQDYSYNFNRPYQHPQDYFLASQQQQQQQYHHHHQSLTMGRGQRPRSMLSATMGRRQNWNLNQQRPLCKCRVIYLGSSVPHVTKNGLHGIQEPLKHLYPEEQFSSSSSSSSSSGASDMPKGANVDEANLNTIDISHLSSGLGIDSWMSVWSNGLLLENVDELGRQVSRFFAIDSLHYCAAVRYFDTRRLSGSSNQQQQQQVDVNNNSQEPPRAHFLPLDAPIFRLPQMLDPAHPPVFAAILRRTSGVKVLECHAFICRRDAAANALVRCCTQSYGDLLSARRLSLELGAIHGDEKRRRNKCKSSEANNNNNSNNLGSQRSSINSKGRSRRSRQSAADELAGAAAKSSSDETTTSNYAIISRNQHQQTKASNKTSESEQEESQRQRKGSSRSLFTEFAPPEVALDAESLSNEATTIDETKRLSQSLDLLRIDSSANDTCCDQHYSVVTRERRHRRHSRSMHNLERAGASSEAARRRTGRQPAHHSGSTQRQRRRHQPTSQLQPQPPHEQHRRRSASVHDIHTTANELPTEAERIYEPPPMIASGKSRVRSQKSGNGSKHQRQAQPSPLPPPPPPLPAPPTSFQQQQPLYLPPHALYLGGPPHAQPHPLSHPAYHHMGPQNYLPYLPAYLPHHHQHPTSSTLAKFMRLSPPLSYLDQSNEVPSKASKGSDQRLEVRSDEQTVAGQRVVSGQPCFVAATKGRHSHGHGHNHNHDHEEEHDENNRRSDKKMSWIKRLSLTMSAGSVSLAPSSGGRRKRTSLFAGGLTLGRSRQPSDVIGGQ